ncbi:hypothetical protein GCM10011505_50770 [Tistrella bauzanensis]|uniref:Uncharacterized protein n=1 Tax=Tistrella bauzanensis TaxID=657419 RepID=A0ABQ1JCS5_9PROT|nr:hypothetical protein GCM10011505_50770 [Tistrella bauzanensis]
MSAGHAPVDPDGRQSAGRNVLSLDRAVYLNAYLTRRKGMSPASSFFTLCGRGWGAEGLMGATA